MTSGRKKKKKKDMTLHEKPSPLGVSFYLVLFPTTACDAEPSACTGDSSSRQGSLVTISKTAYV